MENNLPKINRRVLLSSRPIGIPQKEHFTISEIPIQTPGPGQVLIRNEWLSVEPAMRGWVNAVANYSTPVAIGDVMRAFTAGHVIASNDSAWPVGIPVTGQFGWQEYALVKGSDIQRKIEEADLPLSTALGILGLNGITAHYGMLKIGQPRKGETVIVSTAAGAVGSCAGQIAKILGCHVIGIAGGPDKTKMCIERFGYDAAVDYKAHDFEEQLASVCGDGVDVYFDCTSGPITDAVMRHLRIGARIAICGTASVASWDPLPLGPRVERTLLVKRARIEGFVITDHEDKEPAARAELATWLREGKLKYVEDILHGIEEAPDAIAGLYRGENKGKRLIQL